LTIKSFSIDYDKIYQKIILIESIYKSNNDNKFLENLNVLNSKKLLDFYKGKNLEFLFFLENLSNEEINKNKPNI